MTVLPPPPSEKYTIPAEPGASLRAASAGHTIFAAILIAWMLLVLAFRKNPDGSVKAEVLTAGFYLLFFACGLALRYIRYGPARAALWAWIVLSGLGGSFGALVLLIRWSH